MANKFTDTIKKNPNARDPQGQNFDRAEWEKNTAKHAQDVQNQMKANEEKYKVQEQSKLKEQVSKMKGVQSKQEPSKSPNHDR